MRGPAVVDNESRGPLNSPLRCDRRRIIFRALLSAFVGEPPLSPRTRVSEWRETAAGRGTEDVSGRTEMRLSVRFSRIRGNVRGVARASDDRAFREAFPK